MRPMLHSLRRFYALPLPALLCLAVACSGSGATGGSSGTSGGAEGTDAGDAAIDHAPSGGGADGGSNTPPTTFLAVCVLGSETVWTDRAHFYGEVTYANAGAKLTLYPLLHGASDLSEASRVGPPIQFPEGRLSSDGIYDANAGSVTISTSAIPGASAYVYTEFSGRFRNTGKQPSLCLNVTEPQRPRRPVGCAVIAASATDTFKGGSDWLVLGTETRTNNEVHLSELDCK